MYVVDNETRFSTARLLPNVSTNTIWKGTVECWACMYTGLPNWTLTYQGSHCEVNFFVLARLANVEVNWSGIEAHAGLGLVERYHEPFPTTFRKIEISRPDVDKHLALSCSVNAINDTLEPEGLVPLACFRGIPIIQYEI